MTNVVEMTLAALVGLVANVHTGLESLSHKNYEEAIVSFSTVINAEPSVKDMRALSLLYRAEAYAGKGQKAEALADAVTLLKTSDDSEIKRKAAAIYTAQGGILVGWKCYEGVGCHAACEVGGGCGIGRFGNALSGLGG